MNAVRTVVVWCPDWPVTAAARDAGQPPDAPLAVLDKGRIFACSPTARASGVRRELRVREAQARCPALVVLPYDPAVDAREFEPVVAAIEALAPGVEIIRPGRCALAAKGPVRYYGDAFGQILRTRLAEAGFDCVVGIADGPFAAEQAARQAEQAGEHVLAFPAGESARYLAPLPVDTLDRPELVDLLRRLGVRTLGAFAALPARQVLGRFGTDGVVAHRLAAGLDDRPLATRRPPPELATHAAFEPAVERVDQVAFAIRSTAEHLVAGLAERDLVCTCLRVEIHTERDAPRSRQWRHPRWFSAADVVDRVRWQLQGTGTTSDGPAEELTSGVVRVLLIPDDVARTGAYQDGLWGDQAPDERIHRAFTRVQSMLGHEAVVTAVLSGGRAPSERVTLVPWGDEVTPTRPTEPPWPGRLPPPAPATVFPTPEPVVVLDAAGHVVEVDERGTVSGGCRALARRGAGGSASGTGGESTSKSGSESGSGSSGSAGGNGAGGNGAGGNGAGGNGASGNGASGTAEIVGWAGPWPVDERWWDPRTSHRCARFQVACADGRAFVLRYEATAATGHWWIEASYD